ncbi:MAG: DUF58 domain-containing protein [Saprospiraceae bacterium]
MANPVLDNQQIRTLGGNLELLAQQVVEGFIVGLHRSPFHGFSVEFAEHRLYNPGESTRNIDWKVYARTDKLFVKRYEEETNLRCQIVVDASSTMYYPWDEKNPEKYRYENKFAFAAQSAAVLMNILQRQRDAFGLTLFDDQVRINTRCKSSAIHYRLLLSYLSERLENPQLNRPTDLAANLHEIAESIHRRSLVVIFTDVMENPQKAEEVFAALQHLRYNKHEVILFHVTDHKTELRFEFENRPYVFVDMESGHEIKLQPNQIKDYYVEQVDAFKKALRLKCLQFKIDFVEADIRDGFLPVLQAWMAKRAKMG